MLESLVTAAVLATAGCAVLIRLVSPRGSAAAGTGIAGTGVGRAGVTGTGWEGVGERPAFVNLVLANCVTGAAAYQATILDLAARGFLAASSEPGTLWIRPAGTPATAPALAGYEQRVLGDMRARLADTGGAPFQALAEVCTADVRGAWEPFEQELVAEARRTGICRPVLPGTARTAVLAGTVTAAVAGLAALIAWSRPLAAMDSPGVTSLVAVIAFWCLLRWLGRHDRLTAVGTAMAARWKRRRADLAAAAATWDDVVPVALRQRALAVAAGIPQAVPGPGRVAAGAQRRAPRRRPTGPGRRRLPGRPGATQRPASAWSSFSGEWRLVPVKRTSTLGMRGGVAILAGGASLGVVAYAVSIPAGTGPLPLLLAADAAAVTAVGVRRILRLSALPSTATFDGQVIARWEEQDNSENGSGTVPHIAVDDGQRAWTFTGREVYHRVALGDLVRVTVNPRSGSLGNLTVAGRPRKEDTPEDHIEQAHESLRRPPATRR
jgi:hypothetical protein